MGILTKNRSACLALLLFFAGCSKGSLTKLPSELVEVQREANLTRDTLSGTWDGTLRSADGQAQETFYLLFTQPNEISLTGSRLVRERIELGGTTRLDTFALANGVFQKPDVKFNLSSGGSLVIQSGSPVLYQGKLTENSYMSGFVVAADLLVGNWEARRRSP